MRTFINPPSGFLLLFVCHLLFDLVLSAWAVFFATVLSGEFLGQCNRAPDVRLACHTSPACLNGNDQAYLTGR